MPSRSAIAAQSRSAPASSTRRSRSASSSAVQRAARGDAGFGSSLASGASPECDARAGRAMGDGDGAGDASVDGDARRDAGGELAEGLGRVRGVARQTTAE